MKKHLAVQVFLTVLLSSGIVYADEAEKGRNAGLEAGNKMRLELDSTDEINKRAVQPLTSEATPMQTFGPENEQQAFNAQLIAPSSDIFLKIVIHPGQSQDLGLTVNEDTDFDGHTDYIYNPPVKISGVCANGIISCDAGTWENCAYYAWKTDNNMEVSIQQKDSIEDLAACYCINMSCDSHLVNDNPGVILKDLGAGITAAIQAENPRCVITDVLVEADSISYYGLETSGISDNNDVYFSGTANPQEYYKDGNLPVEQEITRQINDPDSYYSQLESAFTAQPYAGLVSCVVSHNIEFAKNGATSTFEGSVGVAEDNFWGGNKIITIFDTISLGPSIVISAFITHTRYDDAIKIYVNGHLAWQDWPGCYERGTNFYTTPWAAVPADYFNSGDNTLYADICIQGGGEGWFGYQIDTYDYDPYLITGGNCNLPGNSCQLKEEKVCDSAGVNCVQTWYNFNPTGLTPLPMCETITSADVGSYTACMDGSTATVYSGSYSEVVASGEDMWWHIERTYLCEEDGKYNFDNVLQRTRHIRDTEQDTLDSMHFEDYDPETNKTTAYDIDLPDRPDYETCEKACKLKKPAEDTKAGTPGTTAQYRNTVKSYVYVYKKCENDICPVSGNEQIVKDCGCLNDFAEAASIMQVLNNASKDAECGEYDDQGNCLNIIHIFNGNDQRCRSDGITIGDDNCCKDDEFWFGLGECKEQEKDLATSKKKGLCHYIDKYCSKELDLEFDKICIEHSKTYCCFNSKLARIIHEQGRPQLKGEISSWGSAKNPNCQGLTPEEFQMLDFSRIDLSEWYEDIETRTQDQIETEMEESVQNFYDQFN